jgi:hypothetical protein
MLPLLYLLPPLLWLAVCLPLRLLLWLRLALGVRVSQCLLPTAFQCLPRVRSHWAQCAPAPAPTSLPLAGRALRSTGWG